jgi:hypothetical protein
LHGTRKQRNQILLVSQLFLFCACFTISLSLSALFALLPGFLTFIQL